MVKYRLRKAFRSRIIPKLAYLPRVVGDQVYVANSRYCGFRCSMRPSSDQDIKRIHRLLRFAKYINNFTHTTYDITKHYYACIWLFMRASWVVFAKFILVSLLLCYVVQVVCVKLCFYLTRCVCLISFRRALERLKLQQRLLAT